jgi:enoyl-CoA hydratase/carnithine racemase
MSQLSDYQNKYAFAQIIRSASGVLTVTMSTKGGSWVFSNDAHANLGYMFEDIAEDPDNKVVVFTGAGDAFCNTAIMEEVGAIFMSMNPTQVDAWYWDGKRFLTKLLEIEVPVIFAVNGPAVIHGEIFMGAELVFASESATFQDGTHIPTGNVPGGDTQAIWEELLRLNRHRYFQFAGQMLTAQQAYAAGAVSEVVAADKLMQHTMKHAEKLAALPIDTLRATRLALNERMRRLVRAEAGPGMAFLGMSLLDNYGALAAAKPAKDDVASNQKFDTYRSKYPNMKMERRGGVLQLTLHTDGDSFVITDAAHRDFGPAFADIAADRANKVLLLTGTGDVFCTGVRPDDPTTFTTVHGLDRLFNEAVDRDMAMFNLPIPVIAAVNGPAHVHADVPIAADIVLAADTASFKDFHLPLLASGGVAQVLWQELLGTVSGNYFMLTGQILDAKTALEKGVVSEVLPADKLMARAWEHAERLAALPELVLRYTRLSVTQRIKKRILEEAPYGYALIGLAALENVSAAQP